MLFQFAHHIYMDIGRPGRLRKSAATGYILSGKIFSMAEHLLLLPYQPFVCGRIYNSLILVVRCSFGVQEVVLSRLGV
jgi:hypothetical protein